MNQKSLSERLAIIESKLAYNDKPMPWDRIGFPLWLARKAGFETLEEYEKHLTKERDRFIDEHHDEILQNGFESPPCCPKHDLFPDDPSEYAKWKYDLDLYYGWRWLKGYDRPLV
jgi:hypothetical protein